MRELFVFFSVITLALGMFRFAYDAGSPGMMVLAWHLFWIPIGGGAATLIFGRRWAPLGGIMPLLASWLAIAMFYNSFTPS